MKNITKHNEITVNFTFGAVSICFACNIGPEDSELVRRTISPHVNAIVAALYEQFNAEWEGVNRLNGLLSAAATGAMASVHAMRQAGIKTPIPEDRRKLYWDAVRYGFDIFISRTWTDGVIIGFDEVETLALETYDISEDAKTCDIPSLAYGGFMVALTICAELWESRRRLSHQ